MYMGKYKNFNKTLQIIVLMTICLTLSSLWFCFRIYRNWEEPVPGMKVTFEMYKGEVELEHSLIQVVLFLSIYLIILGLMVLYYLRKCSAFEKTKIHRAVEE